MQATYVTAASLDTKQPLSTVDAMRHNVKTGCDVMTGSFVLFLRTWFMPCSLPLVDYALLRKVCAHRFNAGTEPAPLARALR